MAAVQSASVYDRCNQSEARISRASLRHVGRSGETGGGLQPLLCCCAAVTVLAALFLATGAFALDPGRALTQLRLSVWTSESGLPQATVNTIVQTTDGYLWMGTEEGLVRFDGVRFVVSDRQNAPALRSPFI